MNPIAVLFAPGFEEGETFTIADVAVAGRNLITSQGPATGYPFAFKPA